MNPVKLAFRFVRASFSLALEHPSLQEPWFVLGLGGLAIVFVWFLPLAAVVGFIGLTPIGLLLTGLIAFFLWSSLWLWGEFMRLRTSQVFEGIITAGEYDRSERQPWIRFLPDILTLSLSSLPMRLSDGLQKLFSPNRSVQTQKQIWHQASWLALPLMAGEGLHLKAAFDRIKTIVYQNLVRFQTHLIAVRPLAVLFHMLMSLLGLILAFWVGIRIADPLTAAPGRRILAAGIALLIAWLPTQIGILFSSFIRSCYTTALYQWVRNVENARGSGENQQAQPPQILAQVMGSSPLKKER